jgi:hypothetical protein
VCREPDEQEGGIPLSHAPVTPGLRTQCMELDKTDIRDFHITPGLRRDTLRLAGVH